MMDAVSAGHQEVPPSQEEKAARRWNRATLLVVLIFVLVLGILPLLAALVDLPG